MGITLTSEDSSEVASLLVENYNYDRSRWPSGRRGIFDTHTAIMLFVWLWLFVDGRGLLRR